MNHDQIISGLKELAISCDAAVERVTNRHTIDQIRDQQVLVLAAADAIMKLRWRLCTQAMELERAEAAVDSGPDYWPLLEPDDDPGMGL
jgi:hypothetical protein